MERTGVERRRGRRANLKASLLIRRFGTSGLGPAKEELAENISLAGVYFETEESSAYVAHDVVMTSVSIPDQHTRQFPFTRVAGRGRVVRVHELPVEDPSGRKRFGIALEFGDDVTALTAIPARG